MFNKIAKLEEKSYKMSFKALPVKIQVCLNMKFSYLKTWKFIEEVCPLISLTKNFWKQYKSQNNPF